MPYLTPDQDEIGQGVIRLIVTAPNSPYFLGQLRAVFVDLSTPDNYEQHGSATPDQTADEWLVAAFEIWGVDDGGV